ncbi:Hypothetical protein J6898_04998 [Nakaseomyces glabratus]
MSKENLLLKLDRLEYQWHYLQETHENFEPRFPFTQRFFNAKGKKNNKKVTKILESSDKEKVRSDLKEARVEILNRKIHNVEKHVNNYLFKTIKSIVSNDKSVFQPVLEAVEAKYGAGDAGLHDFCEIVTKSKAIKFIISKLQKSSANIASANEEVSDKRIPKWAADHEYVKMWIDKNNKYNPSKVWNEDVTKIKSCDALISRVMNGKKYKQMMDQFDDSLDLFLNINKQKRLQKQQEKKKSTKTSSKQHEEENEDASGDDFGYSDNDDPRYNENIDEDELLKQYDGMLVGSDDESDEEEDSAKSSASEDETSERIGKQEPVPKLKKKEKAKLPELMVGYVSGGSDEEIEVDDIAKEQIEIKPQKKNRRGQRARRKIWEQKYGSKAKHVQREIEKEMEKKRKRQAEYEERVAKRAARAEQNEEYQAKKAEIKREKEEHRKKLEKIEDHPSWVAKKMAEDKEKNAKFAGKKITFD